ncbi:MAG: putative ATP-dependent endonuclease of the family [Tepidanaerobacteraceae bacterium]|nr:putative ATP-dependent endonuclease of the family [Tepidanaerobacteraceae bacterium]
MIIKKLKVKNFRSLKDIEVDFQSDLTLIVGENDSGKSSLLDVLRILFNVGEDTKRDKKDKFKIEDGDYYLEERKGKQNNLEGNEGEQIIEFKAILFNDVEIKYRKNKDEFEPNLEIWLPSAEFRKYIDSPEEIEKLSLQEIKNKLVLLEGANKRRKDNEENLKNRFKQILEESKEDILTKSKIKSSISKIEDYLNQYFTVVYLSGKTFYNIEDIILKIYLKQDFDAIWDKKIMLRDTEKTLEEILEDEVTNIIKEKEDGVINKEVLPDIKKFLPNISRISLVPNFFPIDITQKFVELKVSFEDDNNREILLDKKGDGTKRRVTLALLNYARQLDTDKPVLYLFDEPDTHLHVKAQYELLTILDELKEKNQVIITTHSPFIINYMPPHKITLFELKEGQTRVKRIVEDADVGNLLKDLGIENSNLFFTRKILLLEGKSDKAAIDMLYFKWKSRFLKNDLIAVITLDGNGNACSFARLIQEFMPDVPVYIFLDRDVKNNPKHNIHKFVKECQEKGIKIIDLYVGTKELEDAFSDDILVESIYKIIINNNFDAGINITQEEIKNRIMFWRKELNNNNEFKFSKEIQKFIQDKTGKPIDKEEITSQIAICCPEDKIPEEIIDLFEKMRD